MNQATVDKQPDYRGVIRGEQLSLVRHSSWMPEPFGFARPVLCENTYAAIVDLEVIRGSGGLELIVTEITRRGSGVIREAIIAFAAPLGYRRVWLKDDVIELDPFASLCLAASTTCPACGTTFHEDTPEFILTARRHGVWPPTCPLDGQPLPQWSLCATSDQTFQRGNTSLSRPLERDDR